MSGMVDLSGLACAAVVRWTADARAMADWAAGAIPGDRMIYATALTEPRGTGAWAEARRLSDAGIVSLYRRRIGQGWEWGMERREVVVRRRPAAVRDGRPGKSGPRRPQSAEDRALRAERELDRVLRVLTAAARERRPCPSDAEIGRACGIGTATASHRFRQLKDRQHIACAEVAPFETRKVRIVRLKLETR